MISAGTRKSQKLARKATVDFDLNITAINGHSRTVAPVGGGGGGRRVGGWDGTLIYQLYGYAKCEQTV